jgi:hypothetical protein
MFSNVEDAYALSMKYYDEQQAKSIENPVDDDEDKLGNKTNE